MDEFIYLDGDLYPPEKARLPVTEEGFLYGLGLFETIRIEDGIPLFLEEHLTRLFTACRMIQLHPSQNRKKMREGIQQLISKRGLVLGRMRLNVIPCHFFITAQEGLPYKTKDYQEGLSACILPERRRKNSLLSRIKSFSFLENILGRRWALARGAREGLFLNEEGHLCEGSISNLFFLYQGRWVTPALDQGLLPGVTRGLVLELLKTEGNVEGEQRDLKKEDLYQAEEAFLTNSLMEIMPLTSCDGFPMGTGSPGEETQKLKRKYQELKEEEKNQ